MHATEQHQPEHDEAQAESEKRDQQRKPSLGRDAHRIWVELPSLKWVEGGDARAHAQHQQHHAQCQCNADERGTQPTHA